jgi:hypothetical protein
MQSTIKPTAASGPQIEPLKCLAATNRCARAILNHAATQTKADSGTQSTVDVLCGALRVESGEIVSRRQLVQTLKMFSAAGYGKFIAGRQGMPSRFVWALPLVTVAAMGNGAAADAAPTGTPALTEPALCSHSFRLRQQLMVTFNLPSDLTAREAERLALFVRALPLKED